MSNKNLGISTKAAVLALVLFAVAIGITTYLYRQSMHRAQEVSLQQPMVENLASDTPAAAVEQPTAASAPAAAPAMHSTPVLPESPAEELPTQAAEKPVLKTMSPVSGDAIGEYAMDCLSYNETTRDWRTHNGVDLAAESGSPVVAAADGTVYTTYEDDSMGHTVVIRHEGGYTTRYSSLQDAPCVQAGDTVTMGQTIGQAGDSALVETVMGSHVHFSVSYQDLPMDPAEFLAMG